MYQSKRHVGLCLIFPSSTKRPWKHESVSSSDHLCSPTDEFWDSVLPRVPQRRALPDMSVTLHLSVLPGTCRASFVRSAFVYSGMLLAVWTLWWVKTSSRRWNDETLRDRERNRERWWAKRCLGALVRASSIRTGNDWLAAWKVIYDLLVRNLPSETSGSEKLQSDAQ